MVEPRAGAKRFRIEQLEDRIAPGVLVFGGVFDVASETLTPAGVAVAGQVHDLGSETLVLHADKISKLRANLAAVQQSGYSVAANNPASRVEELLEQVDRHLGDTSGGRNTYVSPHLIAEIDRELEKQGVNGVSFSRVMELLAEVDVCLTDQDNAPPSASGIIRMLSENEEQLNFAEPVHGRAGSSSGP